MVQRPSQRTSIPDAVRYLHPELATIQELNDYQEEEKISKDVARQRRLLRSKYYPELFFRHPKELVQIDPVYKPDGNVSYFSTVTMENPSFGNDFIWTVPLMMSLNQQFSAGLPDEKRQEFLDSVTALTKLVSLDEIKDILNFGDELNQALDRVTLRVNSYDAERQLLVNEIRKKTEIIEEFRELLNIALLTRWFCIKSKNERKAMIEHGHNIRMKRKEITEAVDLQIIHYGDAELVYAYLYFTAQGFKNIGMGKYASWIEEERQRIKSSF